MRGGGRASPAAAAALRLRLMGVGLGAGLGVRRSGRLALAAVAENGGRVRVAAGPAVAVAVAVPAVPVGVRGLLLNRHYSGDAQRDALQSRREVYLGRRQRKNALSSPPAVGSYGAARCSLAAAGGALRCGRAFSSRKSDPLWISGDDRLRPSSSSSSSSSDNNSKKTQQKRAKQKDTTRDSKTRRKQHPGGDDFSWGGESATSFDPQSRAARSLSPEDRDMAAKLSLSDAQVTELSDLLASVRNFEKDKMRELTEARQAAEASATEALEFADGEDLDEGGLAVDEDGQLLGLEPDDREEDDVEEVEELDLSNLPPALAAAIRSGKAVPVAGRAVGDARLDADEFVPSLDELMAVERQRRSAGVEPGEPVQPILPAEIEAVLREEGGIDMVSMDVSEKCTFVAHMIFVTGRSRLHMLRMSERVLGDFRNRIRALSPNLPCEVEGREADDWMCVDTGECLVHVLSPEGRAHWKLDELWLNRPVITHSVKAVREAFDGSGDLGDADNSVEDVEFHIRQSKLKRKARRRQDRKRSAGAGGREDEDVRDFGSPASESLIADFYESGEEPEAEQPAGSFYRR